ncbi:hypothetical protein TH4_08235 [Thalassospira tepidiphila MCCC 1A03514]|uniref:Uncharacterized protein n=1 Tax=Thalassospira tepidiphila MCCC 1A03514 TaxID=1177930 RepID=A0A853L057_9PROT|nr:hypothetical protein TH4_08235 [Thalassospira tepidiphila MCCC 1A03514]
MRNQFRSVFGGGSEPPIRGHALREVCKHAQVSKVTKAQQCGASDMLIPSPVLSIKFRLLPAVAWIAS